MALGPDKGGDAGGKDVNKDRDVKGADRPLTKDDAKNIRDGLDAIGDLNKGKGPGQK